MFLMSIFVFVKQDDLLLKSFIYFFFLIFYFFFIIIFLRLKKDYHLNLIFILDRKTLKMIFFCNFNVKAVNLALCALSAY